MENEKVINQWDNAAKNYSSNQRTAINNIANWQILKELLGDINEKTILDAGCGDGFFANELKSLGSKVYGCDGSKEILKIAKQDFKDIEFQVQDLTKDFNYNSNMFDIIVSSLVLMDIDYLDKFFSESHRILKENGRLVFSIVHPSFFQADWEFDENHNKIFKKIYNYLDLKTLTLNIWGETTHYHRPISWYSQTLKKAGFVIEEIKERPDNEEIFKIMKPHQKRVPLFLCFSCKKIN